MAEQKGAEENKISISYTSVVFPQKRKRRKRKKRKIKKGSGARLYENMPIQIYWKFCHQQKWKFQIKNSDIFHISAQNIDCEYSLEPPPRGGSNEYPQSMFWEK